MSFEFARPVYLLLMLGLGPVIYFFVTSEAFIPRWRRWTSLVLRTAFLLMLTFALAELRIIRRNEQLAVIFAFDVSDSIEPAQRRDVMQTLNEAVKEMTKKEIAGVVTFGSEASIEAPLQPRPELRKFSSIPRTTGSDISRAIRLAVSSFPEGAEKKVVLITDGNQTTGDAAREAILARRNNVTIDGILLSGVEKREVVVTGVDVPNSVEKDTPFEIRIHTVSNYVAPAVLNIYRNDIRIYSQKVKVPVGEEVFTATDRLADENFYIYTVTIEPEGDTNRQNNVGYGFVRVEGRPLVLYAEGLPGAAAYLAEALSSEGILAHVTKTGAFPEDLAELERYDAVILSDVPADSLFAGDLNQMEMIRAYVHDLGGGLIMAGGKQSFGPGGYYQTPVEEALPVSMEVTKKRYFGQTAIVIVIDQSGSMQATVPGGQTKMQLANEAAARTVDLLFSTDKIGVIMCDTHPKWITRKVEEIRDKAHQKSISRKIRANYGGGGGIYVYSGLHEAYKYLTKTKANVKHIILFADTQDCEQQEGCYELVKENFNKHNITLTSIGLGRNTDPHVPFLNSIRKAGKGRIETTADARKVPQLFTKETMLVAKQPIREESFKPVVAGYSQAVRGIDWAGAPNLNGYVITTPKSLSEIVLKTPFDDDTLFAQWQYGLGRSVAFTSDVKNNWASDWLAWPGYRKFWSQTVRLVMRNRNPSGYTISTGIAQGDGSIVIDVIDDAGNFRNFLNLEARIVRPDASSIAVHLTQKGPGRYSCNFNSEDKGNYIITIVEKTEDGELPVTTIGEAQPYSPEYRSMKSDPYLLERICSAGGGKILSDTAGLFEHSGIPGRSMQAIWEQLLAASLFVMLLDIAIRRVMITGDTLAKLMIWRRRKAEVKSTTTMTALKKAKAIAEKRRFAPSEEAPEPAMNLLRDSGMKEKIPAEKVEEEKKKPAEAEEQSYTSRLMDAKRRARK